jgi:HEAT repeat protein
MTTTTQPDVLIRKLIDRLGDRDPVTRLNAAGALRLHGARAVPAIPALRALLSDEDLRVREEAKRAIRRLKTESAAEE